MTDLALLLEDRDDVFRECRGRGSGVRGRGTALEEQEQRGGDHGVTLTFTKPLVQQHWAWPAFATPEASLARTRRMYSPGLAKLTVVEALPLAESTAGLGLSKLTRAPAGAWWTSQVSVTGTPARPS